MTRIRISPLAPAALAAALALGAPALRAQHEPAPQAHAEAPNPQANDAHAAPHGEAAPAHGDAHGAGTGAAHGEGAHHGPVVKLGSHVLGPGAQFGIKLLNFAIFAGGLFFLLKGVLSAAFKARAKELQESLAQAEREKAEGEAQIRELEARMTGLQQELDEILAKAQSDAEAEKVRILEGARAEAEGIVLQARQDIVFHQRQAEKELRALVADLAVQGAQARLEARVQADTARQVMDRAIAQVGGVQ